MVLTRAGVGPLTTVVTCLRKELARAELQQLDNMGVCLVLLRRKVPLSWFKGNPKGKLPFLRPMLYECWLLLCLCSVAFGALMKGWTICEFVLEGPWALFAWRPKRNQASTLKPKP